MRAGSRVVAVLLAAAVWIYAAMSVAPIPLAHEAGAASALGAAASWVRSVID